MTAFTTRVRIARPIEAVYAYLADPLNFPDWNSAVDAVWQTGATYAMERTLSGRRVRNALEIFQSSPPTEFGIRTTSGPTPFTYRYQLSAEGTETVVLLDADVEIDGAASIAGPLVARAVKRGVDANFAVLKRSLEGPRPDHRAA